MGRSNTARCRHVSLARVAKARSEIQNLLLPTREVSPYESSCLPDDLPLLTHGCTYLTSDLYLYTTVHLALDMAIKIHHIQVTLVVTLGCFINLLECELKLINDYYEKAIMILSLGTGISSIEVKLV